MNIKKIVRPIISGVMVAAIMLGNGNDYSNLKRDCGLKKEKRYIIQTKNANELERLKRKYETTESATEKEEGINKYNMSTMLLTDKDLYELKKSDKTVFVEQDSIIEGCKNKVAIIDSGIDFVSDIEVQERKNFIPGEDKVSALYEDNSGHGTSVAGIIAAKRNGEGIDGINENVEIISAKVLDENNQAPISRVINAIEWAIDKKVEYPAAFPETLAVGSVGSNGIISEESSVGERIDVVAPGEQILSTSAFGGIMASGGTSVAAPHVTGIASILLQKNKDVPKDFISKLICDSAKKAGDENENEIECFQDTQIIEGRWTRGIHAKMVPSGFLTEEEIKVMKIGAKLQDDKENYGLYGKVANPQFHGYTGKEKDTNYVACYIMLSKMASVYYKGNYVKPNKINGLTDADYKAITSPIFNGSGKLGNGGKSRSWSDILAGYTVNRKNKALIVYGMALHTAADAFAHSVCVNGKQLDEPECDKLTNNDKIYYSGMRYNSAAYIAQMLATHIRNKKPGTATDFVIPENKRGL